MNMNPASFPQSAPEPLDAAGMKRARARKGMRVRLYILLAGLDSLLLIASFVVAGWVRFDDLANFHAFILGSAFLLVYLIAALNLHAYSVMILEKPVRAMANTIKALGVAAVTVVGFAFFLKVSAEISRFTLVFGAGLAALSIAAARLMMVNAIKKAFGDTHYSVISIHDEVQGDVRTSSVFFNGNPMPHDSANYLDPAQQDPDTYARLANVLHGADRAVIYCTPERRNLWSQVLKSACVQGEVVVPELQQFNALGISSIGGVPTVVVSGRPLPISARVQKRVLDVAIAGGALIVLSPLLLLAALLIKLDTRGPILFVQPRIGEGNKMFNVLKFRSMYAHSSDTKGDRSTADMDPRVTRVGRILRKSSIDELPQLLNVIRGEMSIVGPRPHAVGSRAADRLFWEIDQHYWHRHRSKPGLTGLAQIRGFRGATVAERDLKNRLQSDLEYVNNWSIWRDLKIILLTARVLIHRNAY